MSKVAAVATAAALIALLSILGTWAAQSYFATINRAEERAVASVKIVVRIPMMPDGYSDAKPDRHSNLMPDTVPI
ncbi:hypothetical protein shn_30415 (plasmid) [Shinella sp. HZN7]|nr:hypothetical protein shn_30415 [Shinella sp. HZN7]